MTRSARLPVLPAALAAPAAAALLAAAAAVPAAATPLRIDVTNHAPAEGLYLTPLLAVFHDGGFDAFDAGETAGAGLELLAEDGDPSGVISGPASGFQTAVVTAPGGFPGAPVLDPGETASLIVDVDPGTALYFSFLAMVIPSNDNFIGNEDPFAIPLFDAMGAFLDPAEVEIRGAQIWDAGTEVDQASGAGAPFSPVGGTSPDENGVVHLDAMLAGLLGIPRASGGAVGAVPGASDLFVSISISEVSQVPVPAAGPLALAGLAALGWIGRRRRRA